MNQKKKYAYKLVSRYAMEDYLNTMDGMGYHLWDVYPSGENYGVVMFLIEDGKPDAELGEGRKEDSAET